MKKSIVPSFLCEKMAFKKRHIRRRPKLLGRCVELKKIKNVFGARIIQIERTVIELQKQSFFQVGANVGYEER